jgi:PPM family protein phosphatase
MRLTVGSRSDTGKVRTLNEDAVACDPRLGLIVVCDGMGGEAAGEVASQLAVETIVADLGRDGANLDPGLSAGSEGFFSRTRRLGSAVKHANDIIFQDSRSNFDRAGMGSTIVSAWIGDNIVSLAHVGDSRAYLWRNRQLQQLTRDHSLVERKVQAGLLTRAESLVSTERNILLRALGREPEVEIELAEVPLITGDCLLLCTDGLTGMVADERMAETIGSLAAPQEICDHLVALANLNGGQDNITVAVAKLTRENFWRRFFGG